MRQRVLCFGGRNYSDRLGVDMALRQLLARGEFHDFAIVHGGARGADSLCGDWGSKRGHPVIVVAAPWDTQGKRAGTMRNGWMLELCSPTFAVGFPGGPGSADMAAKCTAAGLALWLPFGP